MTETINIRHDAPVEVTIKTGSRVLSVHEMPMNLVGAHMTVQAYCLGGAFNGVDWHDNKGKSITRPQVNVRLIDDAYILSEGEFCTCSDCVVEGEGR